MLTYSLFEPIEPYNQGFLKVDDIHELYWEECGNPEGIPVVVVHGGPGAGCSKVQRRFFDPKIWRIILFDQRGSGRSLPTSESRNNTSEALIGDIEQLRRSMNISQWVIHGGSWGSTLALLYAIAHPTSVKGLIIRGIFLFRDFEVDWFFKGIRHVFPEIWEKFASLVSPEKRDNLLDAYWELLSSPDEDVRQKAAEYWMEYESSCATLYPGEEAICSKKDSRYFQTLPYIEAFYFKFRKPKDPDKIIRNIDVLRSIPAIILHGRYDMICPIQSAYDLHKAWPEARFHVIPDAGHSAMENSMMAAIIEATENFGKTL